jgi:hypothetical protein
MKKIGIGSIILAIPVFYLASYSVQCRQATAMADMFTAREAGALFLLAIVLAGLIGYRRIRRMK